MRLRRQKQDHPQGWAILRAIIARHRARVGLLALVSFAGAALEALFLVLLTGIAMAMINSISHVGPVYGFTLPVQQALIIAGASLALRVGLNLTGVAISTRLTAIVTTEQRRDLATAYLKSSWATQQAEPSGRLQELLTSFVAQTNQAVMTLTGAVTALLNVVAFLGAGVLVDPLSSVIALTAMAVVGLMLTPLRRMIRSRSKASARANLNFANSVSEFGSLGLEMQAFGVRGRFVDQISELTKETTSAHRRVQLISQSLSPIYIAMAYAAVLGGVAYFSLAGTGDLAVIGAVMLLLLRSLSYGQQLASAAGTLGATVPFLERVEETIRRYKVSPAPVGELVPDAPTPIKAVDVGFAYSPDRPALADVSFELSAGEVLGVVGPSGAGKSTLAQLLLGLREPTEGTLQVGGISMEDVDRSWWSRQVAFVAQEANLFTGTVGENIKFFRSGITESDMRLAAKRANVLDLIDKLPEGFDTHLGERGSQLSGGQRQRLSIARALAGSPRLLVMDEPTSALDGESEALIRGTLMNLRGRVSVVLIAHRMSTLDSCDRIMVVEGGRMTAIDRPDNLASRNAFYRHALEIAGLE